MPTKISNPTTHEYAPFYSDYIQRASQRSDVYAALSQQIDELHAALDPLTETQARFRPGPFEPAQDQPQEWSIKEVIGHLNDVERVFSYRLLRISRNDATPLPGFEQEDFVREAGFDNASLKDLVCELEYLRRANILTIQNMSKTALHRYGTASEMTVSARALIFMLVGHVDHHMASLREKYLPEAIKL
jgi:hypothetical protein